MRREWDVNETFSSRFHENRFATSQLLFVTYSAISWNAIYKMAWKFTLKTETAGKLGPPRTFKHTPKLVRSIDWNFVRCRMIHENSSFVASTAQTYQESNFTAKKSFGLWVCSFGPEKADSFHSGKIFLFLLLLKSWATRAKVPGKRRLPRKLIKNLTGDRVSYSAASLELGS